jgi:hypothetical protein
MVGGTVIEVVDLATQVYVNCADKPRGRAKADECAIYVERTAESEKIEIGDAIWWQGRVAYWTPCQNRVSAQEAGRRGRRCGTDFDIAIPKLGYSGVKHPSRQSSQR